MLKKRSLEDNMTAKVIPFAPIERLIRTAGAHRVSESAGMALTDILEEYGFQISKEAIRLAEHAGRKTVKAEDIKLAKEML
ncbi:MAG: histone family protein [Euryarchaeota archaeon]|nr:histone family protein [Euryarchaeota archaeon]